MRALVLAACLCGTAVTGHAEETDWAAVNEALLAKAPAHLRTLTQQEFCIGVGLALRQSQLPNGYDGEQAEPLALAEARRRRLTINVTHAREERVRIGTTECQLLASMGRPRDQNRTLVRGAVHIQYVYAWGYAYTTNGIVVALQD